MEKILNIWLKKLFMDIIRKAQANKIKTEKLEYIK